MDLKTFVVIGIISGLAMIFSGNNIVGLTVFLTGLFIFSSQAKAETYYSFKFKTKDELKISVPAASYEEAYKKATMQCYQLLTKGVYPGDQEGLEIITTCANPLK